MGDQVHETTILLIEVGGLLLALSLLARLATRFGISPIPLYLLAGLAFGNGGALPLSASPESPGSRPPVLSRNSFETLDVSVTAKPR